MGFQRRSLFQLAGAAALLRSRVFGQQAQVQMPGRGPAQGQRRPMNNGGHPEQFPVSSERASVALISGDNRRKNAYNALKTIDKDLRLKMKGKKYVVIKPNIVNTYNRPEGQPLVVAAVCSICGRRHARNTSGTDTGRRSKRIVCPRLECQREARRLRRIWARPHQIPESIQADMFGKTLEREYSLHDLLRRLVRDIAPVERQPDLARRHVGAGLVNCDDGWRNGRMAQRGI